MVIRRAKSTLINLQKFFYSRYTEIPAYSLAAFRICFGLLMIILIARFFYYGWIDKYFIQPKFHLKYYGFYWVSALPNNGMYYFFALMSIFAIFIAIGFLYRLSVICFFLMFSYFHLIDVSIYLNHYYLISLIAFLLIFVPAHSTFSCDALKREIAPVRHIHIDMLRLQLFLVYLFGGIAKLNYDWLVHAQPLGIWLQLRQLPFLGRWLQHSTMAYAISYAGLIFDLAIGFCLFKKQIRKYAYPIVIVFHLLTFLLFDIGMFPWLMIFLTSIFFHPTWPISLLSFLKKPGKFKIKNKTNKTIDINKIFLTFFLSYFIIQSLIPLRRFLYTGSSHWHEQGFRFSWMVMVMQKSGNLEYQIKLVKSERTYSLDPREYLAAHQVVMLSTQPDLILQFAHTLSKELTTKIQGDFKIYAEAWVSLNKRRAQRLIKKNVNLLDIDEGFKPYNWVTNLKN